MIEIITFILAVVIVSWTGWQVYKSEKEFNRALANYWKTYYALEETKLQIKNTKHKKRKVI
jgi:hypothetical protein